jgi:hypothetical protein
MHTPPNHLHTASRNLLDGIWNFPEASGKCKGRQWGAGTGRAAGGDWVLCAHLSCCILLGNATCCQHTRNLQQAANQSDHSRFPSGSIRKADRQVKPTLEPGAKLDSSACVQDNACVPQDAPALPAHRNSKSGTFSLLAAAGSCIRPGDLHLQASCTGTDTQHRCRGAASRGDTDLTNKLGCLGVFEGVHASLHGTLQTDSRSLSTYGRCLESAARGPL